MALDISSVIRQWLREAPEDRDIRLGAMMLLRLDRNKIFYSACIANPARYAAQLEKKLRDQLAIKQAATTPQQAQALADEAESIMAESSQIKKIKGGKRPDHDSLPPEIQKLYVDNLELRHRMQQYHLQIRTLRDADTECSRDDIKKIVALLKATDVKYHKNWQLYDDYGRLKDEPLQES